eukprot:7917951-Alexandrium_andersonii.AAC.1
MALDGRSFHGTAISHSPPGLPAIGRQLSPDSGGAVSDPAPRAVSWLPASGREVCLLGPRLGWLLTL